MKIVLLVVSPSANFRMKGFSFILLIIIFNTSSFAQTYKPLKLFDLATAADLVTYGTISKVNDQYFYLDCFNTRHQKTTIKVKRFIAIKDSYRWEKYEAGQKVFAFLKVENNEYRLLSTGVEAEIPIFKDSLVIPMVCFMPQTSQNMVPKGHEQDYIKQQTFSIGAKKVYGLRFTPQYLYQSIMAFRDCYQVILKKPNSIPSYTCFNFFDRYIREKIDNQKRKSKLMKLMYNDMEEAQRVNCK